jgi:dephospho-CoA kinase
LGANAKMAIGLTGGIGMGKSEAARCFKKLGVYVIDADKISHIITKRGSSALKELVEKFGKKIIRKNGTLNKKFFAEIIFNDKREKVKAEKILHKQIISKIKSDVKKKGEKYNILIDAPLLFETGLDRVCDKVLVISTNKKTQIERLKKRQNFNNQDIEKRIKSQMPIKEKIKKADFVINNNSGKKELEEQVNKIFLKLFVRNNAL